MSRNIEEIINFLNSTFKNVLTDIHFRINEEDKDVVDIVNNDSNLSLRQIPIDKVFEIYDSITKLQNITIREII